MMAAVATRATRATMQPGRAFGLSCHFRSRSDAANTVPHPSRRSGCCGQSSKNSARITTRPESHTDEANHTSPIGSSALGLDAVELAPFG